MHPEFPMWLSALNHIGLGITVLLVSAFKHIHAYSSFLGYSDTTHTGVYRIASDQVTLPLLDTHSVYKIASKAYNCRTCFLCLRLWRLHNCVCGLTGLCHYTIHQMLRISNQSTVDLNLWTRLSLTSKHAASKLTEPTNLVSYQDTSCPENHWPCPERFWSQNKHSIILASKREGVEGQFCLHTAILASLPPWTLERFGHRMYLVISS